MTPGNPGNVSSLRGSLKWGTGRVAGKHGEQNATPVCCSGLPDLHAYKDKFMFPNGNIGLRAALGTYMYTNDHLKTV